MSNTEIQSKVNELRELRRMADELAAEIEAAQDAIKAHMTAIDADTLTGVDYKITSSFLPVIRSTPHLPVPAARQGRFSSSYRRLLPLAA